MPTSTTRRSCLPRARETSPRRESRSTRRVTSGSRAIIRCEISLQASRVGWLPRRIRSTLYCSLLSPAWVFRNRSHGSMMRAEAISTPSSTSCSPDVNALFCFSSLAMTLAISAGGQNTRDNDYRQEVFVGGAGHQSAPRGPWVIDLTGSFHGKGKGITDCRATQWTPDSAADRESSDECGRTVWNISCPSQVCLPFQGGYEHAAEILARPAA